MSVDTDQMVFEGNPHEQQLAREIWLAMRMLGTTFAQHAPIRQPLPALAGFFGRLPLLAGTADAATTIDAALSKNTAIFAREETADGVVTFATTKAGVAPQLQADDQVHSLKSRLTQPAPAPVIERSVEAVVAPRVAEGWLRPTSPTAEVAEGNELDLAVADSAPLVTEATLLDRLVEAEPVVVAPAAPSRPPVAEEPAVVVSATPMAEEPVAVVSATPMAEVIPPVEIEPARLEAALYERLASDARFVSFGNEWFIDDLVLRLSRSDFRRLKDYINERGEPLLDADLLNDILGRRVTDRDYQLARFGLNVRLSKEKKDFDFVGTAQARLWSTPSLPAMGTAKRKPAEIGQDFRFLLESTAQPTVGNSLEHTLTFYEYEYGVLSLEAVLSAFFPPPFAEEQRVAVLRFEVPQLYVSYLVELRYPTANRGGFISGLEQFYAENLVAGATLSLERTDNNGVYTVKFGQTAAQERRLLHLDERRGRFVFRPVTFFCTINEDMLLADTKFGGLNNAKPLDDKERRRPELVLRTTFERVGDQVGDQTSPRYWALADDLLAAANIERPFTAEYLRATLEAPQHPEFERDADGNAYFYNPLNVQ